jgi:hypothetical protein
VGSGTRPVQTKIIIFEEHLIFFSSVCGHRKKLLYIGSANTPVFADLEDREHTCFAPSVL